MASQNIEQLNESYLSPILNNLEQSFTSDHSSAAAVLSLVKTIQSHNITMENWNKIVHFVSSNKNQLDKLYQTIPDAIAYLYNQVKADTQQYVDKLNGINITSMDVIIDVED